MLLLVFRQNGFSGRLLRDARIQAGFAAFPKLRLFQCNAASHLAGLAVRRSLMHSIYSIYSIYSITKAG